MGAIAYFCVTHCLHMLICPVKKIPFELHSTHIHYCAAVGSRLFCVICLCIICSPAEMTSGFFVAIFDASSLSFSLSLLLTLSFSLYIDHDRAF